VAKLLELIPKPSHLPPRGRGTMTISHAEFISRCKNRNPIPLRWYGFATGWDRWN
jgi:hypothetical protein